MRKGQILSFASALMSNWINTSEFSEKIGIHKQTLLVLRRSELSPFREGIDYRWSGLTRNGHLQWHAGNAEVAFTNFKRVSSMREFAKVSEAN